MILCKNHFLFILANGLVVKNYCKSDSNGPRINPKWRLGSLSHFLIREFSFFISIFHLCLCLLLYKLVPFFTNDLTLSNSSLICHTLGITHEGCSLLGLLGLYTLLQSSVREALEIIFYEIRVGHHLSPFSFPPPVSIFSTLFFPTSFMTHVWLFLKGHCFLQFFEENE